MTKVLVFGNSGSGKTTVARARAWEPHKYESKAAQDANLEMLLEWIGGYETRDDTFSRTAHKRLYDRYNGNKHRCTANQ